jgi:hypothetical protein
MRYTKQQLINYMKKIAKLHDVKIRFCSEMNGGSYWDGEMVVGTNCTKSQMVTNFCHELGHHKNKLENKYIAYHNIKYDYLIPIIGLENYAEIATEAEAYTDKVGKEIAKVWFPKVKYEGGYKNNKFWLGFFTGYYSVS